MEPNHRMPAGRPVGRHDASGKGVLEVDSGIDSPNSSTVVRMTDCPSFGSSESNMERIEWIPTDRWHSAKCPSERQGRQPEEP